MLNRIKVFLLFSYILSVLFGPRLCVFFGDVIPRNFRLEDVFFPAMFVVCMLSLRKRTLVLGQAPIIYHTYIFIVTLLGIILYSMPVSILLIWGKVFQYVVGFILFIECMRSNPKLLIYFEKIAIVACFVSAGYVLYRMNSLSDRQQYGILHFTALVSTSISAWMYFNLFYLSVVVRKIGHTGIHKRFFFVLHILLFMGTLLSGTRTMFICLPVFLMVYCLKKFRLKKAMVFLSIIAVPIVFFGFFHETIVSYLFSINALIIAVPLHRASCLFQYMAGNNLGLLMLSRGNSWLSKLGLAFSGYAFIFGGGRGFTHLNDDGTVPLGLGGDTQYAVNIAEIGIFGSILFFLTLRIVYTFVHRNLRWLYLPYLAVYLLGSMAGEFFMLSKSGQLFWLVTAYFIVKSEELKSQEIENYKPGQIQVNIPV